MWGKARRARRKLEQMMSGEWVCASCGNTHSGLFDLAAFAPDPWEGEDAYEPNAALRLEGDFLSEDFCVIGGEHFFVRGVALVPIVGFEEPFAFGAWSTLSRDSLDQYIEGFNGGHYAPGAGWFGWFSNDFLTFPNTLGQRCDVLVQQDRQRPLLVLQDKDHELGRVQGEGIEPARLLQVFQAYGHAP